MKKITALILAVCFLCAVTACAKAEASLVGTWIGKDGEDELLYVFREDGTGTAKAGNASSDFTYAVEDGKISVTLGDVTNSASFEVTESTLSITDEYGTTVLTRK